MTISPWYVYLVQSEVTGKLYTGISPDPNRRLLEHNTSSKGAKATRAGRPWKLVYQEGYPSKGAALKREAAIKRLPRVQKLCLVYDHKHGRPEDPGSNRADRTPGR